MMGKGSFDFEKEVKDHYADAEVINTTLKDIYNVSKNGKSGMSTEETRKKGVYALFYKGKLQKMGNETYKDCIFHRMSQYYRLDESGGLAEITENNKDQIKVSYFNLDSIEECWFAERRLQVIAHDCGEDMPWENKTKN